MLYMYSMSVYIYVKTVVTVVFKLIIIEKLLFLSFFSTIGNYYTFRYVLPNMAIFIIVKCIVEKNFSHFFLYIYICYV